MAHNRQNPMIYTDGSGPIIEERLDGDFTPTSFLNPKDMSETQVSEFTTEAFNQKEIKKSTDAFQASLDAIAELQEKITDDEIKAWLDKLMDDVFEQKSQMDSNSLTYPDDLNKLTLILRQVKQVHENERAYNLNQNDINRRILNQSLQELYAQGREAQGHASPVWRAVGLTAVFAGIALVGLGSLAMAVSAVIAFSGISAPLAIGTMIAGGAALVAGIFLVPFGEHILEKKPCKATGFSKDIGMFADKIKDKAFGAPSMIEKIKREHRYKRSPS